jgi:hypothetical protein
LLKGASSQKNKSCKSKHNHFKSQN